MPVTINGHRVTATCTVEFTGGTLPGHRFYRITGATRAAVQAAIDERMREVEACTGGGCATFENPWMTRDGTFISRGEVVLTPRATVPQ